MLTIKEFYEWAVRNGLENAHFGIDLTATPEDGEGDAEVCEPVNREDLRVGEYWDAPDGKWRKVEDEFVWLTKDLTE